MGEFKSLFILKLISEVVLKMLKLFLVLGVPDSPPYFPSKSVLLLKQQTEDSRAMETSHSRHYTNLALSH